MVRRAQLVVLLGVALLASPARAADPTVVKTTACDFPSDPSSTAGLAPSDPAIVDAADADARALIDTINLPPDAAAATDEPAGSALDTPPQCAGTPDQFGYHAFWVADEDDASVIDWVNQHPPANSHGTGSGASSAPGVAPLTYTEFGFPATAGLPTGSLFVSVRALSPSRTAIRVDTQVIYENPRPATERVPSGVVSIKVLFKPSPFTRPPAPTKRVTVTNARRARKIVALTDGLPAAQPGTFSCPLDDGSKVVVKFLDTNGAPLARAVAGGCSFVSFRIAGVAQPPLRSFDYVKRLQALLPTSRKP